MNDDNRKSTRSVHYPARRFHGRMRDDERELYDPAGDQAGCVCVSRTRRLAGEESLRPGDPGYDDAVYEHLLNLLSVAEQALDMHEVPDRLLEPLPRALIEVYVAARDYVRKRLDDEVASNFVAR